MKNSDDIKTHHTRIKGQSKRLDFASIHSSMVLLQRRGIVKIRRREVDLYELRDDKGNINSTFATSLEKCDSNCFDMMRLVHALLTFDGENVKTLTPKLKEMVEKHIIFRTPNDSHNA